MALTLAVVALAPQKQRGLLVLDWANKAAAENAPVAILIEMGLQDSKTTKGRDWSGAATVTGAKVVHREGYRFRPTEGDNLLEGDSWKAASHKGLRVPKGQPKVSKMEPVATVGVVLHLVDVKDGAALTIEPKDKEFAKAVVPLNEVLAGKAHALWNGAAVVRLVSTAVPLNESKTEDDFPAAAYGPDGTLWVAYTSYTLRDEGRHIEAKQLASQPKDFKGFYKQELADQLWVKSFKDGKWHGPTAITGAHESIARCAVAVEGTGDVWIFYSAFRDGRHELFARTVKSKGMTVDLGPEVKLPGKGVSNVGPVATTKANGELLIAYQYWSSQGIPRMGRIAGKDGKFTNADSWIGEGVWTTAVAAGPDGTAIAYDDYRAGDFDVHLQLESKDVTNSAVTGSAQYEARPSCAYDAKGRLWIAFEVGPEKWGKDYGALVHGVGNPLYNERWVRVVCRDTDGKLYEPAAELPLHKVPPPKIPFTPEQTHAFEKSTKFAYPKIGIDGKGRVWLTFRASFGSRYSSHPGSYWVTFARRLDGDHWSEPIEVHHSDGLLDSRPALLPHQSGGLVVIHNADGRMNTPEVIHNQVYRSVINLAGEPVEPKLKPFTPAQRTKAEVALATKERQLVEAIRKYRIKGEGKDLMLLRGDFHRHTEISWDGGGDGSLEDMFRYAVNAASMDWIGCGDHDNGAGREYSWWLTQKFDDAFHAPGAFTPMFTYERSVAYPHGHRNVMFAKRGILTLPRLAAPTKDDAVGGIHADDTKMLYRYLHELGGICASHTSATSMGTDWRDKDNAVEPVVEIYQGDRMSYEHEGAPRAGYEADKGKEPVNIAGWYPKGFVNLALLQGHKLGFQASSDHWSTHISFFVVLSDKNDRQSLVEAIKKRHCYGATDNIIVEFRSGDHIMGDEFKTKEAAKLAIHVAGTAKIAKIDIMRDSEVVHTIKPDGEKYTGNWTDPNPVAGVHYYYIRVLQTDEQIAWASPMWIEMTK
jgi:hypothetical protein